MRVTQKSTDRRNASPILVAQRNVQQQVYDAADAESREAFGHLRPNATQRGYAEIVNIASISTPAPLGKEAMPIAARAGYGSSKYSAITSLTNGK